MGKTAFIFPGQGSQYVGMGKGFYDLYSEAREVYELASKACGLDICSICFEENDRINQTEYTQIAMFTTEAAILAVVEAAGIKADICAGLSLGEYAALAAAKVLDIEALCTLVRKRGKFMQEACPTGGAMTAVLGMDTEKIKEICDKTEGIVTIANYNCPGQIVISGEEAAVLAACESLKAAGAKRCIPLKVSGPFHSVMLKNASENLRPELDKCDFKKPFIPYYSNVDATLVEDEKIIAGLLEEQMISSVCWEQSIRKMIADGVDTFIEIGPGKTLSGFLGRINREVRVFNVDKVEDFDKLKGLL